MTLNLGLAVALACALLTQIGFLCKHRGANHAPKIEFQKPLQSAKIIVSPKIRAKVRNDRMRFPPVGGCRAILSRPA